MWIILLALFAMFCVAMILRYCGDAIASLEAFLEGKGAVVEPDDNCLDLDFLEVGNLFADIEKAFAVDLSEEDWAGVETIGQLFDRVCSRRSRLKDVGKCTGSLSCPNARAFLRLHAALRRLGYAKAMSVRSDLRSILAALRGKRLYAALSREAGLELPDLELHPVSWMVLGLVASIGIAVSAWLFRLGFSGLWGFVMLPTGALAIAMIADSLPGRIPARLARLGDFAADVAVWNYGRLYGEAGGATRRDAWKVFTTVAGKNAPWFRGEMNTDTRF